jgi:hypothetical protein
MEVKAMTANYPLQPIKVMATPKKYTKVKVLRITEIQHET